IMPSDSYSESVADSAEDIGQDSWGSLYTWGVSGQFKASSIHSSILIPSSAFLFGGGGESLFKSSAGGSSTSGDKSAEILDNFSGNKPSFIHSSNTIDNSTEKLSGRTNSFSFTKKGVALGTVSLNLAQFKGREPFVVKTPAGESVAEIQPGSPLAFLHLNRQSAVLRQMSPLERIQTMTNDLKAAFGLIDNQDLFNGLKPEQQSVLTAARSAVIVGISHLVPLFRRRTGLPTWKLDVLPQAVQQLHRLDSQAVSNQFGGHRQVRVEDVEMMIITPQMRQQLATVYA
ncbi:hypothetical protein KKH13_00440, partial [Patescibacteria group bacterium]|nr:hypothetical protein [Patescibacteria group bacterium]